MMHFGKQMVIGKMRHDFSDYPIIYNKIWCTDKYFPTINISTMSSATVASSIVKKIQVPSLARPMTFFDSPGSKLITHAYPSGRFIRDSSRNNNGYRHRIRDCDRASFIIASSWHAPRAHQHAVSWIITIVFGTISRIDVPAVLGSWRLIAF